VQGEFVRITRGLAMSDSAEPFVCPWACVAFSSLKPYEVPRAFSTPSFAQALIGKVGVDDFHLP
jgi:hypothetical protein